jgi:hypothetical protein
MPPAWTTRPGQEPASWQPWHMAKYRWAHLTEATRLLGTMVGGYSDAMIGCSTTPGGRRGSRKR